MSSMYTLAHRFQISPENVEQVRAVCRPSQCFSWVGKVNLRIHTFRGVPGKHVDLLFADRYRAGEPYYAAPRSGQENFKWLLVCDVGRKEGRFDGAERWRITFRDLPPFAEAHAPIPHGRMMVDEIAGETAVIAHWGQGRERDAWTCGFPRLEWAPSAGTDYVGILIRQAQMYFRHLWPSEEAEVRALAESWASLPSTVGEQDINQLNRDASAALYDLSRNLGWTKCTLAMRERYGLGADAAQWQRADRIDRLRAERLGIAQGVGEYTLTAGNGRHAIRLPLGVCPQCHELSSECECVA